MNRTEPAAGQLRVFNQSFRYLQLGPTQPRGMVRFYEGQTVLLLEKHLVGPVTVWTVAVVGGRLHDINADSLFGNSDLVAEADSERT